MEDRFRLFLYALSGAGGFALVGAAFGGVAGAVFRAAGRAATGFLGATVLAAVERVAGRELPRAAAGAFTGAADGAFFLGVVGSLVGLYAAGRGLDLSWVWAWTGATALLALGAVLFGGLAYSATAMGARAFQVLLLGMIAGAAAGALGGGDLVRAAAALAGLKPGADDAAFAAAVGGAVVGGILAAGIIRWW